MTRILRSGWFIVGSYLFFFLSLVFLYLTAFTSTGLEREAYNRGEEVYTVSLSYFGKKTYGGGVIPWPEKLSIETKGGRVLSPDEMVRVLDPELKPFVSNGKVYIRTEEHSEWGRKVYWAPANPVTSGIAGALRFIRRQN